MANFASSARFNANDGLVDFPPRCRYQDVVRNHSNDETRYYAINEENDSPTQPNESVQVVEPRIQEIASNGNWSTVTGTLKFITELLMRILKIILLLGFITLVGFACYWFWKNFEDYQKLLDEELLLKRTQAEKALNESLKEFENKRKKIEIQIESSSGATSNFREFQLLMLINVLVIIVINAIISMR